MRRTQPWKRIRPTIRDASSSAEQRASRASEPASSAEQRARMVTPSTSMDALNGIRRCIVWADAEGYKSWKTVHPGTHPGTETRCKLLATFARTATGVQELDNGDTIWQCNWVRITEPSEGQNIKSSDGTQLWLPLTLRDESGFIVLYITEQAVLKLANVLDAAEFEQLYSEGRLRFPFWASVKIWRRPSKASAAQPGTPQKHDKNDFDCFIVDAAEQDVRRPPLSAPPCCFLC